MRRVLSRCDGYLSFRWLPILAATVFLGGCIHPPDVRNEAWSGRSLAYQPADPESNLPRGYADEELESGRHAVVVRGSGVDQHERLRDIALWRAAAIGKQNGFERFQLIVLEQGMVCDLANTISDPTVAIEVEYRALNFSDKNGRVYQTAAMLHAYESIIEMGSRDVLLREWDVAENRSICASMMRTSDEGGAN